MYCFAFEEERKSYSILLCCLFLFSDIVIQYPQFFGHSYVTFEPLKNSYQAFQITLEFRVRRITCLMNAYQTDILAEHCAVSNAAGWECRKCGDK